MNSTIAIWKNRDMLAFHQPYDPHNKNLWKCPFVLVFTNSIEAWIGFKNSIEASIGFKNKSKF
jgi:hypothetical protein